VILKNTIEAMSTGANALFFARASNLRTRSDIGQHLVASNARVFQEKIELRWTALNGHSAKPAGLRFWKL
jgi:hypothetical protein